MKLWGTFGGKGLDVPIKKAFGGPKRRGLGAFLGPLGFKGLGHQFRVE